MTCPRIILLAACLGLFVLYGVAAPPASPARAGKVLAWSSPEEFDRCYRDRYLDSIAQPGAVTLVRRVLVADEMGAGYDDFQPIRGKTLAKKLLPVADPRVTDAQLIVDGSASACDILINGTPLRAKVLEKSYWNANFERFPVPPQLLKAGMNEIVFRARGNGSGAIRVERSQQPNRSAVSHDGGATWEYDQFGDGGYINGELGVRLNLGRYAPAAWLASPVIDLAATVMHDGMSAGAFAAWQTKSNQPVTMPLDGIPAGLNGRIDALTVDAVAPKGTAVRAFVRTGPTPDGNPERWSAWQPWSPTAKIAWARFAQWRLELATSAAQLAPVVRGVALRVSAVASPEPAGMRSRLARDDNQVIVRSSYPFAYADYHGNARVLRNNWKLADVIAGQDTEFAKLAALRQWVRNQWNDGWDMGSLNYIPSWDARVILSLAPGNRALGMCTHFATTFVQCAQALGYPARAIFRGHALSEAWSNEHRKWMVMDAGMDPNDRRKSTYSFERNGVPLNELEVHQAYFIDKKWDDIVVKATNISEGTEQVEAPFVPEDKRAELFESTRQLFMPLRSNFVDHREPEEPEHGQGYFKFLGFIFWKDTATPDIPWTDFFTTRKADLYWTLNQAQIYLQRDEKSPATLRVMLDTVTPNFAGYEYRVDGGKWIDWAVAPARGVHNPAEVTAYPMAATGGCVEFSWKLHEYVNILEARPYNRAGLRGIISRVEVDAETDNYN